jgi:regulator of replication initiation timing
MGSKEELAKKVDELSKQIDTLRSENNPLLEENVRLRTNTHANSNSSNLTKVTDSSTQSRKVVA